MNVDRWGYPFLITLVLLAVTLFYAGLALSGGSATSSPSPSECLTINGTLYCPAP